MIVPRSLHGEWAPGGAMTAPTHTHSGPCYASSSLTAPSSPSSGKPGPLLICCSARTLTHSASQSLALNNHFANTTCGPRVGEGCVPTIQRQDVNLHLRKHHAWALLGSPHLVEVGQEAGSLVEPPDPETQEWAKWGSFCDRMYPFCFD